LPLGLDGFLVVFIQRNIMTTIKEMKPKPCPFCGLSPEVSYEKFELPDGKFQDLWMIICVNEHCRASVCATAETEEEVYRKWNARFVNHIDHDKLESLIEDCKNPYFCDKAEQADRHWRKKIQEKIDDLKARRKCNDESLTVVTLKDLLK
jgi:hypothetical protein